MTQLPPLNPVINRHGITPKSFWTYQASEETPTLAAAIEIGAIAANTTDQQWEALSPGMRREIIRSHKRRMEARS